MTLVVTFNGNNYNIPDVVGSDGWGPDLTNYLAALAAGAADKVVMRKGIRTVNAASVTVQAPTDFAIIVKRSPAGATTVNLPAGQNGMVYAIVDGTGDAALNTITIIPNGGQQINGTTSHFIQNNRGGVLVAWDGTEWFTLVDANHSLPATVRWGNNLFTRNGNHDLTINTTGATIASLPTGTVTLAGLGTTQTFTGSNTFSSQLLLTAASNQLRLGANLTITGSTSVARTYSIPDTAANSAFVMTDGNQTIAGTKTFSSTISGSITGNANTATTLQTARTINGVSFNGSANITITANTPNTLTRGSFLTGANFNGSAATTWAVDADSANVASKVVARDGSGNFAAGTITAALSGNASTATTLQTSRSLWGNSFNGSADITGAIQAPVGSEAAPSYTFSGNTNTGIFRPDTNTVAISTNGTEKFRIISTGAHTFGAAGSDVTHVMNGNLNVRGGPTVDGTIFLNSDNDSNKSRISGNRRRLSTSSTTSGLDFWTSNAGNEILAQSISSTGSHTIGAAAASTTPHVIHGAFIARAAGSSGATSHFAAADGNYINANAYNSGGSGDRAVVTETGYTRAVVQRITGAGTGACFLIQANYEDAQTANSALVTTNTREVFRVNANGAHFIGPSGGFEGTHTFRARNTVFLNNGGIGPNGFRIGAASTGPAMLSSNAEFTSSSATVFNKPVATRTTLISMANSQGSSGTNVYELYGDDEPTIGTFTISESHLYHKISALGAHTIGPDGFTGTHTVRGRIETTNTANTLPHDIGRSQGATTNVVIRVNKTDTTVANTRLIEGRAAVDSTLLARGYIRVNSASNNLEFEGTSDRRVKKDIIDIPNALQKINETKPRLFEMKEFPGVQCVGFIAQEFKEAFPQAVSTTDNGEGEILPEGVEPWTMSDSIIIPYLTKAIQELAAKLEAAEQRIQELEDK